MTTNATRPAAGARTELGNAVPDGNAPLVAQNPAAVQTAIVALKRDYIAEALRVAAIKAAHGADNILLGDDVNARRDIDIAFQNLREAALAFRELGRAQ